MPVVQFTPENALKCACIRCPVETNSKCSKEKMEAIKKMIASGKKGPMPKPTEVPALYCSSGKASCKDLDFKQMCMCGSCPVWSEYKLPAGKPAAYYCKDGKSR